MEQGVVDSPVILVIRAPNQKYSDQTINCYQNWTVEKLKAHLSDVYPSKPVSIFYRKLSIVLCFNLVVLPFNTLLRPTVCVCVFVYLVLYCVPFQNIVFFFKKKNLCCISDV